MFGGGRAAFDALDACRGRSAARPFQERGDGFATTLRQGFDVPAGEIAHPAGQAQPHCLAVQGVAEADALHASTNAQSNCLQLQNLSLPPLRGRESAGTPW